MLPLGLNEIREKFLSFFESKAHLRLNSFPLVPQNDNSLLLINSGMAPLKPFFTGAETPPRKRVTTCQKCIRTGDIENVGKTARHGTFFEMLGNFSFGDYFKNEAIEWGWEFVTKVMDIPVDRLYASVYYEDDEAYEIWNKKIGLSEDRIFRMGKEDNFWEVGLGPCGPCSEIYFDKGEQYGCGKDSCTVGCDCDRYMEFWNLVFTQFNKNEDGSYSKLDNPNIDTGMGLERIAAMMQGVDSIFDVDTIKAIRDEVCRIAGVEYNADSKKDVSIRVVTDHIRAVTFMTADGVLPSNEGRGYVLRRLLRRAARHGRLLGINHVFLTDLCKIVINLSKGAYPQLEEKQDYIFKVLSVEENRFHETLDAGIEILQKHIKKLKEQNETKLLGGVAFKLYDTFGFPLELTKEILSEEFLITDEKEFLAEMEAQRNRARQAREESTFMGRKDTVYSKLDPALTTEYLRNETESQGAVVELVVNNELAKEAKEGESVSIFLDKTCFYAESGGQKGDSGIIKTDNAEVRIDDCIMVAGHKFAHVGVVVKGEIKVGDKVTTVYDNQKRLSTARNHTATHLMQKALRELLGSHIEQAGSSVSPTRLRFDFTHFAPMTASEIKAVEEKVNDKILECLSVDANEMPIDKARAMGAMALFGEKYGDVVRVVNISDYSIELCGGTHLTNTSQVGVFKILSESGIASGVRRIEALTGKEAFNYFREQDEKISSIATLLKATPESITNKIKTFLEETKSVYSEMEKLKAKASVNIVDDIIAKREVISEQNIMIAQVDNLDMNGLRTMGDIIKDKVSSCAVVLASIQNDKVNLLAMLTEDMVKKGAHAGNIVKAAAQKVGGSGGGKPNIAQAGGKEPSKIGEALEAARSLLIEQIG